MKKIYFDIETIPAEEEKTDLLREIYERRLEKYGASRAGTFEEFMERTGLDGAFGRICCIGYAIDDGEVKALSGDEKEILEKFWDIAKDCSLFIGFNNMDFDLRFIYQRSVVHKVRPTQNLSFARYRNNPIYDCMHEWKKWDNQSSISLHAISKALGIPSPKEGDIEGKDVGKAYADGRIEEICEYCKRDVDVTRQVYKRLTFNSEQTEIPF